MVVVKVWNGSSWVLSDIGVPRVWDGSSWTFPVQRIWDGEGWMTELGITSSSISVDDLTFFEPSTAAFAVETNGDVRSFSYQTYNTIETWIRKSGSINGAMYEVRATVNTGSVSGSATGTWLNLATRREWSVSVDDGTVSAYITVEFRVAGTTGINSSTSVFLSADSQYGGGPPGL